MNLGEWFAEEVACCGMAIHLLYWCNFSVTSNCCRDESQKGTVKKDIQVTQKAKKQSYEHVQTGVKQIFYMKGV